MTIKLRGGAIGQEFDNYLARLRNHLDEGTLEATLGLMVSEYRAAIQKQRGLIGLQRFGGRDTSCHIKRLEKLEAGAAALTIARQDVRVRRGHARPEETVPPGIMSGNHRHEARLR